MCIGEESVCERGARENEQRGSKTHILSSNYLLTRFTAIHTNNILILLNKFFVYCYSQILIQIYSRFFERKKIAHTSENTHIFVL